MKLSGKYRLIVEGDTSKLGVGYEHNIIGHLFQRLLKGDEAVMSGLSNLGITVTLIDPDEEFISIPRLDAPEA